MFELTGFSFRGVRRVDSLKSSCCVLQACLNVMPYYLMINITPFSISESYQNGENHCDNIYHWNSVCELEAFQLARRVPNIGLLHSCSLISDL